MAEQSPKQTVDELRELISGYARQETVEPLKNLGKWVGFGAAGAICMGIGGLLLGLGLLRLLQKWDWTDGGWSFAPYLIVFFVLAGLIGLCGFAMTRKPDWLPQEDA